MIRDTRREADALEVARSPHCSADGRDLLRTDVRGAIRNLTRDVREGSAGWDDPAHGFEEDGRTLTHSEAIAGLTDLLAKGQRYLPDSRRLSFQGREPPWDDLDPGIVELVRLMWDAGFTPTDSGDGVSKVGGSMDGDDGCVIPRPHVALSVDRLDLLVETDRAIAVLEASGRPIDRRGHLRRRRRRADHGVGAGAMSWRDSRCECGASKASSYLLCQTCWRSVDPNVRGAVLATFGAAKRRARADRISLREALLSSQSYLDAAREAQRLDRALRPVQPGLPIR